MSRLGQHVIILWVQERQNLNKNLIKHIEEYTKAALAWQKLITDVIILEID